MFDNFEPKPDKWDRAIRFAFGFFVGAAGGGYYFQPNLDFGSAAIYFVAADSLLLGYLAARHGDRFWRWFVDR